MVGGTQLNHCSLHTQVHTCTNTYIAHTHVHACTHACMHTCTSGWTFCWAPHGLRVYLSGHYDLLLNTSAFSLTRGISSGKPGLQTKVGTGFCPTWDPLNTSRLPSDLGDKPNFDCKHSGTVCFNLQSGSLREHGHLALQLGKLRPGCRKLSVPR